jgi:hypothetical protein
MKQTLAFVLALIGSGVSFAQDLPWDLRKPVFIDRATPVNAIREISRIYRVPVCFEAVARTETSSGADFVTLSLTNVTVRECLDTFCVVATNYVWVYDFASDMVNVQPRGGSALEWRSGATGRIVTTVKDVFSAVGFHERDFHLNPGRGNLAWLDSTVVLARGDVTAVSILNRMCRVIPFRARWEMAYIPGANKKDVLITPCP